MVRLKTYYSSRNDLKAKKVAQFVFMNECANNACADAASMIYSSVNGDPGLFGCDMPLTLLEGDDDGAWLAGYRDLIAVKSAYLLALANYG